MQILSYVHIIRIPVELVLYRLFLNGIVSELMTFKGRNFDILAGITAPLIGFFGIGQSKILSLTAGWIASKHMLSTIYLLMILFFPNYLKIGAFVSLFF